MVLVTRDDVEKWFTPNQVRQTFSDDGGSNPGPRLDNACEAASDEAAAILGKVWTDEDSLRALVANDMSVQFNICKLVMAIGVETRPQWFNKEGPSALWRSEARKTLEGIAARQLRSPGEKQAGENTVMRPRVANARQFEFARRRGHGPSGGF